MANSRYDLVVIGSGPGGYVAAIRASQLKMKVAVIERDLPGGVCLNWGCIPSKALLNSAETMESIRGAGKEHGIEVGEIKLDFKRVIARSREAADKLSKGVRFLLKKNKVDYIEADATIAGPHTVTLRPAAGKAAPPAEAIEAERILIATGSGEKLFPGMAIGDGVMTSREALIHDHLPASVVIIGAGAIGAEFGYFYRAFGAKVTIVELEKQMLPGFDAEIAEELRRAFVKRGTKVLLGHGFKSMTRIRPSNGGGNSGSGGEGSDGAGEVIGKAGGWSVELDASGTPKTIEAEAVLLAVGRNPLSVELGLDKIGVEADRGYIKIDDSFRTACPSVYAIGDVARPPLLAHKVSAEGVAAVEIMAGIREPGFDLLSIPGCIYCEPEVAMVGLSETQARERGIEVKVGKIPFRSNGKAVAINQTEGFVKIVASKEFGEVIGCQIIGHHATDLIGEIVLGRTLEATTAELGHSVHPHPTLSESIMEAALAAEDARLHARARIAGRGGRGSDSRRDWRRADPAGTSSGLYARARSRRGLHQKRGYRVSGGTGPSGVPRRAGDVSRAGAVSWISNCKTRWGEARRFAVSAEARAGVDRRVI
ncbi:MAG: dihydrolipoyl dehydrogenase [Deltaproteobacteria bacterium]|nr:dihydrolipoyl dehydrogenase [Deltaproteobacteria bacterium]